MAALAPSGLTSIRQMGGGSTYYIASDDTNTYALGDVVKTLGPISPPRLPTGLITPGLLTVVKAEDGDLPRGVIVGIDWGPDTPNSLAIPSVKTRAFTVQVDDDPLSLFSIQANNTATIDTTLGTFAGIVVGSPAGSVSSTYLDASSVGATPAMLRIHSVLSGSVPNSTLLVSFTQHELLGGALSADKASQITDGLLLSPSGQLAVGLGDSILQRGYSFGGPGAISSVLGIMTWSSALMNQDIYVPFGMTNTWTGGAVPPDVVNYMLAVAGATTVDIIEDQIEPAAALRAPWWVVLAGVNDLTALAGDSADEICARLQTIYERGLRAGAKIAIVTILPVGDAAFQASSAAIIAAGSTVAEQRLKHMAINNWIRRYCLETPGTVCIDPYWNLVDPASTTGDWLAGYSSDELHPLGNANYVVAQVFSAAMRPHIKPLRFYSNSQADIYDPTDNIGGDIAVTKEMLGSATAVGPPGVSGTVPTGWVVALEAGTATVVCTVQARTDYSSPGVLANGRELEIVASAASADAVIRIYQDETGAVIPAGVPFYAEFAMSVSANSAAWGGPALQVFFAQGTGGFNGGGVWPDGSLLPVGALFDAVIRTPIFVSDGTAGGRLFLQMYLGLLASVTMKIRGISIRRLDQSMPGLLLSNDE